MSMSRVTPKETAALLARFAAYADEVSSGEGDDQAQGLIEDYQAWLEEFEKAGPSKTQHFVASIARMKLDEEDGHNWTNDDAWATLTSLIQQARELV